MRALTFKEAVELALADADASARHKHGLKGYFRKADLISHRRGWIPWWDRSGTWGPHTGEGE